MFSSRSAVILSIGSIALAGCGTGPNRANFESWAAVGPNETVRIDGDVLSADYSATPGGEVTLGTVEERDGQLVVGLDGAGEPEEIDVEAKGASVAFDTGVGDSIVVAGGLIAAETADLEDLAFFADPDAWGFNYQTFGGWMTGIGTAGGVAGVGSFGHASRPSEVPSIGAANYTGGAGGIAVDAAGDPFIVVSEALVAVDFGAETFTFDTFNTVVTNINTAATFAEPLLNLNGGGVLNGPRLMGGVDAVADMAGELEGRFYGPGAEEVGGTYFLTGPAGEYLGAFGAVQ